MLAVHPQGLWLALIVPELQFLVELLVVRNYLLATIFITATALTSSSVAHEVDAWAVLVDRGVDTPIGCTVGVTGSRQQRATAARLGAAVAATERLGYLTVADNARYLVTLHELAEAVRGLGAPPRVAGLPADVTVVATTLSPP
ncbi:hypothetical protein BH10ACT9_BH10ACT9_33320 [soil metagenome]